MLVKEPQSLYNCTFPRQYASAARVSFRTILAALDFNEAKKLLIPAYIGITDREGSGVFDPIQETGTPFDFYPLDRKLSAVEEELHALVSSRKYRALLIIHYFGFCQNNMGRIIEACRQFGVILIEDCAHSMLSRVDEGTLGELGDFSFYSLHKYLATKDGGCLCVNNTTYHYLLEQKPPDMPSVETFQAVAKSDLDKIGKIRRRNYRKLRDLILKLKGIEVMYPEISEGIAPHNFPILVENNQREPLYFKLIKSGIPVIALYYRMIQPIADGDFENAHYVSANILNLPIHQDINEEDLIIIAGALEEALQC